MKNPIIRGMKFPRLQLGVLATILLAVAGTPPASAQLPIVNEPPMLGYHTAYMNRKYQFGMTGSGEISVRLVDSKGQLATSPFIVRITIGIEEVLPDGKTVLRQIKPETLESAQSPNGNFEKTVISGKVSGDAVFEATMEQNRGVITMGGRVTDPGPLVKNPLRFTARMNFPAAYPYDLKGDKQNDKKAVKLFEKKIESDLLELKWTDWKKKKLNFAEIVDASTADINGPGIAEVEIETGACAGKKYLITASPNSAMKLWSAKPAPLHLGFSLHWSPDPAKDPDGKARIGIDLK